MADKDPFTAQDAYQANSLSRKEVMEQSHEAARVMAEMLGQEGQFHTAGAAYGQHSALPLPKTDEKPQEIKFFLHGKPTAHREEPPEPSPQPIDADPGYRQGEEWVDDGHGGYYQSDWREEQEEEEKEELITDILERRLAFLYIAFQPPEPVEGPADTLFIVSKTKEGTGANERILVRAHSQVLKRYNDAFNELIGYRPPAIPTPESEDEAEEIASSTAAEAIPVAMRKSSEWWTRSSSALWPTKNCDEEWCGIDASKQARSEGASQLDGVAEDWRAIEADNQAQDRVQWAGVSEDWRAIEADNQAQDRGHWAGAAEDGGGIDANKESEDQGAGPIPAEVAGSQEPSNGQRGSVRFKEAEFLKHKRPSADLGFLEKNARRPSQAFMDDGLMDLGLEHVIGNLRDSQKPLLVKEFLDASEKLVKLPGWEHLPPEVKESFQQFANSIDNYRSPALQEAVKALDLEYSTLGGGGGLESNFLGIVGRRQSKAMAGILSNITQGVADRKRGTMMLAQAKIDEQAGTGKHVSATAPRTALERRKSAAYLENQEKRKSIAALEPRKSIALIATQDKRISPSFLERRQSKALLEIARRETAKFEADDLNMRRRTSTAAVAAFERRKRMSVLENKSPAELEFSKDFDGSWTGSQKVLPPAKEGRRVSAAKLGLLSGTSEVATEGTGEQARRLSAISLERVGTKKSVSFLERRGSKALIDVNKQERKEWLMNNSAPPPGRRPSQPPSLTHTRKHDKDAVVQFYEEEDTDIYATSSSSSVEPEPPPLPKDVEFVIEKRHWTPDILHAILEFIYTEVVHIHCEELPDVYAAANEILLSSLLDAIRLKPIIQYYNLAMVNEHNRVALLKLANQLTSGADYKNYVNKNEDFHNLRRLCEAYTLASDGPREQKPYILLFETAHIAFRNLPFVTPGLHDINGEMILILKNPREGTRLFELNLEQQEYLTFQKKLSDRHNEKPLVELHWLGKWPALEKTRNRDKAWKIIFFNFLNIYRDIPLKNYGFYKHITAITCRPWAPEVFSLRMVVGLLICPVLFDALLKTFPELEIKAARGAGYYMGGETHGNSITLTGTPRLLLQACMSCPRHMIGRTVLRVSSPSERTFVKLWTSTNRFGVDLYTNVLYFLKPLIQIQKILEYWHELDWEAKFDVLTSREMVELVEPHDPF